MRLFFIWVIALLGVTLPAQNRRSQLTADHVPALEKALLANPHDRAARAALLEYYYLGGFDPEVTIQARRRHILWLIRNAPEDELAGSPAATIDRAGHRLADPEGFQLASAAWRAQIARSDISAPALVHAAYFFKLSDKALSIGLLERAAALEPNNKEIGARLGDAYALAIMGVTMINKNGYPTAVDLGLTRSALAKQSREALEASQNPYVLAKGGYSLLWQGAILYYSGKIPFDTAPLARSALDRAVSLAPGDPEVAAYRDQYESFQKRAGAVAAPEATPEDLKKIVEGSKRDDLLKLGAPAGRITMDDDGHLVEVYDYSHGGVHIGRVRLTDGVVSKVEIP